MEYFELIVNTNSLFGLHQFKKLIGLVVLGLNFILSNIYYTFILQIDRTLSHNNHSRPKIYWNQNNIDTCEYW